MASNLKTTDIVDLTLKDIRRILHRRMRYYQDIIYSNNDSFEDELRKNNNEKLNKALAYLKQMEQFNYTNDKTDIIEQLLFCVIDKKNKEDEEFEIERFRCIIKDDEENSADY